MVNSNKTLSIIIPTYNMEKYLDKCLSSLIVSDDNLDALEVLVINDGSKDSSSEIAHYYERKFPLTFNVIDKGNGNYGSCINRGLKEASGRYVKILDADDHFDKEVLERLITFLKCTDVDMVLTDYNEVDEMGYVRKENKIPYVDRKMMRIVDRCGDKVFTLLQMHAVTYKLTNLLKNGYVQTTGVSYTDQEWMFLPITYMDSFCYFQGKLYQYLVGREGQTIDVSVMSKQAEVLFNLIYKRIDIFMDLYNKGKLDNRKITFLKNRLLNSSYSLYKLSLIKEKISENLINEFDKGVKEHSLYIYEEISKSSICRFRNIEFIGYWRNRKKIPYTIKFYKIAYKLKRIIGL